VADLAALLRDLDAESADADRLVAGLAADQWAVATPAPGWTVAHQIGHLTWTDEQALLAATDAGAFAETLAAFAGDDEPFGLTDREAARLAALDPPALLARWRDGRASLAAALAAMPQGQRLPWFGPPMAVPSMVTARIMETWAHGQDVADALGRRRVPSARLKHVAHIGVRARPFAFHAHGLGTPADEVFVELTGPAGEVWTWGPPDAAHRVTGPALDFCLLVTQRRHRDDLAVQAVGDAADRWLDIAQAFAGPPGPGRRPGQFAAVGGGAPA
jgi:uncharacterized protein (TIGR03084 family)